MALAETPVYSFAMNFVAFCQKKIRKIGFVLAGNTSDECFFHEMQKRAKQKMEEKGSEEKLENLETKKLIRLRAARLRRDE
jgi:phosphopantothenate synthetase